MAVAPEMRPQTPLELNVLLAEVVDSDAMFHLLVLLAAVTGARRAQLLGLRWHNIKLASGRVSFSAGWVEGPNGPVLTPTKTKRSHVVDLDPATVEVLVKHPAVAGPAREAICLPIMAVRPHGNRTG